MRIGFLLGWSDISGGTNVILEYGSRLQRRGHDVTILTKEYVSPERTNWHSEARVMSWKTIESGRKEIFDIVLATWWESPFLLHYFQANHYVYFVQSIESRFWQASDPTNHDTCDNDFGRQLCESTYSYSLPIITEAKWIKHYLHEHFNHSPFLVRNGIRKDIYTLEGEYVQPRSNDIFRVLVEGPLEVFFKNVPRTIELCRQAGVDEIWLLTSSSVNSCSGIDRVFSQIPTKDTAAVYRSCDVLVKLSYVEGMFGPPLEMFHCGGTAIVYDVTGYDEYIVHNYNGLVVKKDDEAQVVASLRALKEQPEMLEALKKGALETAELWPDWNVSCDDFEKVLSVIIEEESTSRSYLERHTEELHEINRLRAEEKAYSLFQEREKTLDKALMINNFVQLYQHGGGAENFFQWRHYLSGGKQNVSFEVSGKSPLSIRLDPSIGVGIVLIDFIRITVVHTGEVLLDLQKSSQLDQLQVSGTCSLISSHDRTLLFSFGRDPQILLPAIEGSLESDMVRIEASFEEMSIGDYLRLSFTVKKSLWGQACNLFRGKFGH